MTNRVCTALSCPILEDGSVNRCWQHDDLVGALAGIREGTSAPVTLTSSVQIVCDTGRAGDEELIRSDWTPLHSYAAAALTVHDVSHHSLQIIHCRQHFQSQLADGCSVPCRQFREAAQEADADTNTVAVSWKSAFAYVDVHVFIQCASSSRPCVRTCTVHQHFSYTPPLMSYARDCH